MMSTQTSSNGNGFGADADGSRPCTNTAPETAAAGISELAMNHWNSTILPALLSSSHPTIVQPVPIRVRLAIVRTNSLHRPAAAAHIAAEGFLSYDASRADRKLETYCPPLSSSANSGNATTIADLTQYIVEDLFINNKEIHFLGHHDPSKFLSILLDSSDQEGRSLFPDDVEFNYGIQQTNKTILGQAQAASSKKSCIILFSLMEETEGYPIDISPSIYAHDMLRNLLLSQQQSSSSTNGKKLDLLLKAHIIMCPSSQTTKKDSSARKRKILCENVERVGDVKGSAKRSKTAKETTLPPDDDAAKHPSK